MKIDTEIWNVVQGRFHIQKRSEEEEEYRIKLVA